MSKPKTIELAQVKKINGKNGAFTVLNFDKTIKNIQITREYEKGGETITEIVNVAGNEVNGKTYLGANVTKAADDVEFRLANDWISEESAEKLLNSYQEYGISSLVKVKVQS